MRHAGPFAGVSHLFVRAGVAQHTRMGGCVSSRNSSLRLFKARLSQPSQLLRPHKSGRQHQPPSQPSPSQQTSGGRKTQSCRLPRPSNPPSHEEEGEQHPRHLLHAHSDPCTGACNSNKKGNTLSPVVPIPATKQPQQQQQQQPQSTSARQRIVHWTSPSSWGVLPGQVSAKPPQGSSASILPSAAGSTGSSGGPGNRRRG